METLLSALIQLFGTISAIALTFLVLLYDTTKRQRESSRERVLAEIKNAFECPQVKTHTGLVQGNELHDRLAEQCTHRQIEEADADEMIKVLHRVITDLRTKFIDVLPPTEAGLRSQAAAHLEKHHERDIKSALLAYSRATKVFSSFPTRARRVVGFPLVLTAIFMLQLVDLGSGSPYLPSHVGAALVPAVSFPCLAYIFLTVTTSLKELHAIEK